MGAWGGDRGRAGAVLAEEGDTGWPCGGWLLHGHPVPPSSPCCLEMASVGVKRRLHLSEPVVKPLSPHAPR